MQRSCKLSRCLQASHNCTSSAYREITYIFFFFPLFLRNWGAQWCYQLPRSLLFANVWLTTHVLLCWFVLCCEDAILSLFGPHDTSLSVSIFHDIMCTDIMQNYDYKHELYVYGQVSLKCTFLWASSKVRWHSTCVALCCMCRGMCRNAQRTCIWMCKAAYGCVCVCVNMYEYVCVCATCMKMPMNMSMCICQCMCQYVHERVCMCSTHTH